MKKLMIIAVALMAALSYSDVLVQWGSSGGGELDIVTANVNGTKVTTWTTNTYQNPAVGASYYPNATGRNPNYHTAISSTLGNNGVDTSTTGDRMYQYRQQTVAGDKFSGMTMWTDQFLTSPSGATLSSFDMQLGARSTNSFSTIQFLVLQDGNYYISQQSFNVSGSGTTNVISQSADSLTWYNFTPFSGGTATIGSAATISLTSVEGVGFYFDSTLGVNAALTDRNNGINTTYFSVSTVVPEPATVGMLGLGALVTLAVRRMKR